jgi:hypothetical protein
MKKLYYISNEDNNIHHTEEPNLFYKTELRDDVTVIQIMTEGGEIVDEVIGYNNLGDLMESINSGGNDLE